MESVGSIEATQARSGGRHAVRALLAVVVVAAALAVVGVGRNHDRGTTAVAAASHHAAAAHGETFADPEGRFAMTVGDDWKAVPFADGVTVWQVGAVTHRFAPTVNVVTADSQENDLQRYLDLMVAGIRDAGLNPKGLTERVVDGAGGTKLGLLDYSGTQAGRELHFLQAVAMKPGAKGVTATLTTTVDSFARIRAGVEPYLLTLQAN
jgi:hypothetical protein